MKNTTRNIVITAFFIALGIILPYFTGQIPRFGRMLLPMHIPVLLCGFVCGPAYGVIAGIMTPLLRSVIAGMPVMYPTAVEMAVELAVYGLMTGLLYRALPKKNIYIYVSLLGAMAAGRIADAITEFLLLGLGGKSFSFSVFLAGAFTNAIPGIILQIVLIPALVMALKKADLIK
jgi:thiamine transporter ThiT